MRPRALSNALFNCIVQPTGGNGVRPASGPGARLRDQRTVRHSREGSMRGWHRNVVRVLAATSVVATLAGGSAMAASAQAPKKPLANHANGHGLKFMGTTNVRQLLANSKPASSASDPRAAGVRIRPYLSPKGTTAPRGTSSGVANPKTVPVVPSNVSAYD